MPKKVKLKEPKERGVYAFTKYRRGDFILYIGTKDNLTYDFMQLPDRFKLSLTKEEFAKGVKDKLLDFVEQIPKDVFEVAAANIQNFEKTS